VPTRGTARGSSSKPVYIASNGRATAITSLDIGSNALTCGTITCSRIIATATTDADEDTATNTALTLGNTSGDHVIIDGNEIIAKNGATAVGPLYLNGLAIGSVFYGSNENNVAEPVKG
jgi:hypothetical protein